MSYRRPCPREEPHPEHDHFTNGWDLYHCVGVRAKPCRCSYLPWEAAHHPMAQAMRAHVFLINPRCPHHGNPAAGWRLLGWGQGTTMWWKPLDGDLSPFPGSGRQPPTPRPERQSSVKQLTTGNPR